MIIGILEGKNKINDNNYNKNNKKNPERDWSLFFSKT